MRALDRELEGLTSEKRTVYMITFLNELLSDTSVNLPYRKEDFVNCECLRHLIPLCYRHLSPDGDPRHPSGTGFHTEQAGPRGNPAISPLHLAREYPRQAAYEVLLELADAFEYEHMREWCLNSAQHRAEEDSEMRGWDAAAVREFADKGVKQPGNHAELYDLTVGRLLDLKHELEDGEDSRASMLQATEREVQLRNDFAYWLRQRSCGIYSVAQEEEFCRRKASRHSSPFRTRGRACVHRTKDS